MIIFLMICLRKDYNQSFRVKFNPDKIKKKDMEIS